MTQSRYVPPIQILGWAVIQSIRPRVPVGKTVITKMAVKAAVDARVLGDHVFHITRRRRSTAFQNGPIVMMSDCVVM